MKWNGGAVTGLGSGTIGVAIFGEANFITPNDTGTVTATFGLAINLGGRAVEASRDRFAPGTSVRM